MLIKSLLIKNLYGNNYYLKFNKDLTILHGVNGSGKTTILNIISDICKGNIIQLLKYEFDFLEMIIGNSNIVIILKGDMYQIRFNHESIWIPKEEGRYYLEKVHSLDSVDTDKRYRNSVVHFHEDVKYPKEIERINQDIQDIFELTYITLDRSIYGSDFKNNNHIRIKVSGRSRNTRGSGIKKALRLANEFYIDYEESILREEGRVQRNLEKSLLEKMAEPIGNVDVMVPIRNEIDIMEMSSILLDKKTSGKIRSNIEQLIEIYNSNMSDLEKRSYSNLSNSKSSNKETLELVNVIVSTKVAYSQLEKIYEVFKYNTKLKRKVEQKKQKLEGTLAHINELLKDTHKKVLFSTEHGLYFKNLRTGQDLPLEHLSSGEIQLVIFMVFSLVKNQSDGELNKVLLIDEPELSLHISWQEKILPLMTKYREKSQMIIATHSPDIIGEMNDKCVEVRGYV